MANFQRFVGKVALIAGGTDGIGYSVAERLAREGAKVVIGSRKKENVDEAVQKLLDQGYQAKGVICHVSNKEQRKELLDAAHEYGGLDILFQNAGINPTSGGVLDCEESVFDKIIDVNLKATFLLSKESLPLLKKSNAGRIIYSGTASSFHYVPFLGAYTVGKTALLGLTKMASIQLGRDNITVNTVVPGIIETKFAKILLSDKKMRDDWIRQMSIKRFGKPEEVANLVAFLASDEAGFITGENILITGGVISRL